MVVPKLELSTSFNLVYKTLQASKKNQLGLYRYYDGSDYLGDNQRGTRLDLQVQLGTNSILICWFLS
jgi:hypothetical protein